MAGDRLAIWGHSTGLEKELGGQARRLADRQILTSGDTFGRTLEPQIGGFGFALLKSVDGRVVIVKWRANVQGHVGAPISESLCPPGEVVSCCAAGYAHAVMGTDTGDLYVWSTKDALLQRAGGIPLAMPVTMVAAGEQHSLALAGGAVWAWGSGAVGQLGQGSRIPQVATPQKITRFEGLGEENGHPTPSQPTTVMIAAGALHSALVLDDGKLFTTGWGLYGQCGHDSTEDVLSPRLVADLQGVPVRQVAAGLWHTACLTHDGAVFTWGGNADGQLGTGLSGGASTPQLVEALPLEEDITKISCGARHAMALTGGGKVFSWGWNKYGQLGHPAGQNVTQPREVEGARAVEDMACGWWHTLVRERADD